MCFNLRMYGAAPTLMLGSDTRVCLHLSICVYILSFAQRDRMARTLLSDEVWNNVKDILPRKAGDRGRTASNNRWFLEALRFVCAVPRHAHDHSLGLFMVTLP